MKGTVVKRFESAEPSESVARVARQSVAMRLLAVEQVAALAALLASDDVEHVHQLRIASRRAEAALTLYREFIPRRRERKLRRMLKRLRRAAGKARDDDVLLARLVAEFREGKPPGLLGELRRHRKKAQRPLKNLYGKLFRRARFRRRAEKARKRMGPSRRGGSPYRFGDWAKQKLRRSLSLFIAAGARDLTHSGALHQFRIRGKQLRYATELLAGAFSMELVKTFHGRLSDIQDRLGEINDRHMGVARLTAMLRAAAVDGDAAPMTDWLAGEKQRADALHRDFLSWWSADERAALARLGRDLAKSRPE